MNALQEAEQSLDNFIVLNISCASCTFWEHELLGGICNGPELPIGYMEDDTSMCEQHEFKDNKLEMQLKGLQAVWYNAWYIVEGFLYSIPPARWEAEQE